MKKKDAVVVHSGGMDSSLCLALAIKEFGMDQVLSLSFKYGQRHAAELEQSGKICRIWGVDHAQISLDCLKEITDNALINHQIPIENINTLVSGRNGLMARVAGIYADHIGANCIYMGVMELEEWNSGYRDCSRRYMDLVQEALRIDFNRPSFEIRTPLVLMTKVETLKLAQKLGVLDFLLNETISCYEGLPLEGCGKCPACNLKNEALKIFYQS